MGNHGADASDNRLLLGSNNRSVALPNSNGGAFGSNVQGDLGEDNASPNAVDLQAIGNAEAAEDNNENRERSDSNA